MARWTDIATWVGPTTNSGDGDSTHLEQSDLMSQHRGLVVHIAEGSDDGTIAWQKNPSADVSSHFIVSKEGHIYQMVDTAEDSWCQIEGNDTWLSIENEGFTPNKLTSAQLDANARLLAKAHKEYGVPLQVATSSSGKGLGHHSMDPNWGHQSCPGPNIIAQKPEIVSRAQQIIEEEQMPTPAEYAKANWDYVIKSSALGDDEASQYIKSARGGEKTLNEQVLPKLAKIEAKLNEPAPVDLSEAQLDALADKVAARLKALTFVAEA